MSLWGKYAREIRERHALWTMTPVALDGMGLGSFDLNAHGQKAFIRPTVVEVDSSQASMHGGSGATSLTDQEGFILTQIFTPRDWKGGFEPHALADQYASLFRHWRSDQMWIDEPRRTFVGLEATGKFFQINVLIPFRILDHTPPSFLLDLERMLFTQTNHGLSQLNVVKKGASAWAKAIGSTGSFGHAVVSAVSGDDFVAVSAGFIERVAHGFTVGSTMWLSTATNGLMSTTSPNDALKQRVGYAVDATTLQIQFQMIGST